MDNLQELDQERFANANGTRFVGATNLGDVVESVSIAFATARSERLPVLLNLPSDLQEQEMPASWQMPPRLVVSDEERDAANDIDQLVEMLRKSKRPVLIAGRGAQLAGAGEAIVNLADKVGALLSTTLLSKDMFDGHEYNVGLSGGYASRVSEEILLNADLVIGVGTQMSVHTMKSGTLFPSAQVVRIDSHSVEKDKRASYDLFVKGDAKLVVEGLSKALADDRPRQGFRTKNVRQRLSTVAGPLEGIDDGLDLRQVIRNLSRVLPSGTLVTTGGGHFLSTVCQYISLPHNSQLNLPVQFGAVGQGLGCAMGIALAHPDRPNILIEGDGSLLMSLQELETVVRCGISLVVIVCNDGGYGAEVHKLAAQGFDPALAQWRTPDFPAIAQVLGGRGCRVTSDSEIGAAVLEGLRSGGLYLIDVPISPSQLSDNYAMRLQKIPNPTPLYRKVYT
jgi:thiamine pyrophosphate-dependent acetolactate synthase large subunit-like protein